MGLERFVGTTRRLGISKLALEDIGRKYGVSRAWTREFNAPAVGKIQVCDGIGVIATHDGRVRGIDVDTGEVLWSRVPRGYAAETRFVHSPGATEVYIPQNSSAFGNAFVGIRHRGLFLIDELRTGNLIELETPEAHNQVQFVTGIGGRIFAMGRHEFGVFNDRVRSDPMLSVDFGMIGDHGAVVNYDAAVNYGDGVAIIDSNSNDAVSSLFYLEMNKINHSRTPSLRGFFDSALVMFTCMHADGDYLAIGTSDGGVFLVDSFRFNQPIRYHAISNNGVEEVYVSGKSLYAAGDGFLAMVDLTSGQATHADIASISSITLRPECQAHDREAASSFSPAALTEFGDYLMFGIQGRSFHESALTILDKATMEHVLTITTPGHIEYAPAVTGKHVIINELMRHKEQVGAEPESHVPSRLICYER